MIKEYISDICNILNISIPSVSYDTSNFPTNTMMAQCSSDGSTIYLKKYNKPNPDQLFSIAHELRHIWQIQNDEQLYFFHTSQLIYALLLKNIIFRLQNWMPMPLLA